MRRFLYFAYGSNMLAERLRARCSTAEVLGRAYAVGWGIRFHKRGRDDSGKAMLVRSERPEDAAHGVLFEIASCQQDALDQAEGEGTGYRRENAFAVIHAASGVEFEAATYLAQDGHIEPSLMPYDWYRALVLAGAYQSELPGGWVDSLSRVPFRADTDPERLERWKAWELLKAAGFRHLIPSPDH